LCLGSVKAQHSSSGHQPNFAALNRAHHQYLAGRPSRWALAHIIVSPEDTDNMYINVLVTILHMNLIRPVASLLFILRLFWICAFAWHKPNFVFFHIILSCLPWIFHLSNSIYLHEWCNLRFEFIVLDVHSVQKIGISIPDVKVWLSVFKSCVYGFCKCIQT